MNATSAAITVLQATDDYGNHATTLPGRRTHEL